MASPAAVASPDGMPHLAGLRVRRHDGTTFVTARQMVIACYPDGDVAMRNVAVAVARQLGLGDQPSAARCGRRPPSAGLLHHRQQLRQLLAALQQLTGDLVAASQAAMLDSSQSHASAIGE